MLVDVPTMEASGNAPLKKLPEIDTLILARLTQHRAGKRDLAGSISDFVCSRFWVLGSIRALTRHEKQMVGLRCGENE